MRIAIYVATIVFAFFGAVIGSAALMGVGTPLAVCGGIACLWVTAVIFIWFMNWLADGGCL